MATDNRPPTDLLAENRELRHRLEQLEETLRTSKEGELVRLNEELEQRVAERTAQLTALNEELDSQALELSLSLEETHKVIAEVERLASFPRLNPNPVLEVSLAGDVIFCNQACMDAISRNDLTDPSAFLPHDLPAFLGSLKGNDPASIYRSVTLQNSVFAETIYFAPQFNSVRIYATDITHRTKAEQRLELLAGTANCLLASDSPQEVIDTICRKVMDFLDCHLFLNFLVDEKKKCLRLNACFGISAEEARSIESLDFSMTLSGLAARDASRIVAEDILNTPVPRTELVKSYGMQAYACHPLLSRGEVLGTLSFGTRTRIRFDDDDLALMKVIADQVAIALERRLADEKLRHAHANLERKVASRTRELATTVNTLQTEIVERQRAELSLVRLNRFHGVLSETNQAIVRAADQETLFNDFCRIAVEQGGFLLAWIGLVDEESGLVKTAASQGATGYLDDIRISVKKEPAGLGPTGIAVREGTYYISNNFLDDPITRPWHEQGRAFGIRASASVALKLENRVIGALTLYAGEKDFFDSEHVKLLRQMGADISFALDNLHREARRREAEMALHEESNRRLQAMETLREKENMLIQQSRLAAMGEMINNIAHQWRQPLNSLGLIIQQVPLFFEHGQFNKEFLDNNTKKAMEIIQHMSRTIDDFRNYFKPDKEKVDFSLQEAVARTLSLMEGSIIHLALAIDVDVQDDPVVYGYPNEFSQVLLNILINARDAFAEREIANPKIAVRICAEENRSVVVIADNAGGIPEEIKDRIFDPYFTTKGPQSGTGLGLFMSKSIVEKNMNGLLTVRNNGEGAEFRIEIGN